METETPNVASELGSTVGSIFQAWNAGDIAVGISRQVQNVMSRLEPLHILTAGRPGCGVMQVTERMFGAKAIRSSDAKTYSANVICYQRKGHPLRIYNARLRDDSYESLQGCMELLQDGKNAEEAALDLLIFYLGDYFGQIETWEYDAMLSLSSQKTIPLLAVLDHAAPDETLTAVRQYLTENCTAEGCVVRENEDLCGAVLVLFPAQEEKKYTEIWDLKKIRSMKQVRENAGETLEKILPPPSKRGTFLHLQQLNYDLKKENINRLIRQAANITAAEAAVCPIPDWIVMAPTEAIMMAGIHSYFEVSVSKRIIKTLIPAVLGTGGATIAGKAASDVLGRIPLPPIVAAFAGVDAITARMITMLIGNAYYQLLLAIEQKEITEEELGSKDGIRKLRKRIKNAKKK